MPADDLARTAVEHSDGEEPPEAVDVGPEIGRYLVIDEVGAGGMGRVFRAYDPRLGREVALKRLHLRRHAPDNDRARMIREAKSMALLSHPNVVAIYDVDVDHGSLFIAMEYVGGGTLAAWMRRRAPWREVVAMFVQAGRGLAAAHAQGIVHRDFKPSNVVIGDDGRPRVMDFGLARAAQAGPESEAHDIVPSALADPELDGHASSSNPGNLGATLTALGTVVGTPAYMAPEQHVGDAVDARTDQYAFCVALWEGLYGSRAFGGRDLAELAVAKLRGPQTQPAGSGVPAALHAAVARGLAPQPEDRWPDMTALLSAVGRESTTRRWRWPLAIGVAGSAIVGAVVWSTREEPCTGGRDEIEQTWSSDARGRVEQALRAGAASFADSTVERVLASLDADALAWTQMHHEACVATNVRHEQSDEALDLRMGCLRGHQRALASTIDVLASADAKITEGAIELVGALPSLARCADVVGLREDAPLGDDDGARERVAELQAQLEQSDVLARAGRLDEALAIAQSVIADPAAVAFEPLRLAAALEEASVLAALDRNAEARPKLEQVFDAALAADDEQVAATAAIELIDLLGNEGIRANDTAWLARIALGLAEADGREPRLISQALLRYGGTFIERELELEGAPYFAAAVERLEGALGPDHPDLVGPLISNASLLGTMGREAEAHEHATRALELAERTYGPDHPRVAGALHQLGWQRLGQRDFEGAREMFDRVFEIDEAAYGRDHPATISALAMRAAPLAELGRYPEAIALAEEAMRRMDTKLPEFHSSRASTMHNLSTLVSMTGDHARAAELLGEVVRQRRGIGHRNTLGSSLSNWGRELRAVGRFAEAEAALTESMMIDKEVHADDGNYDGFADVELADMLRERGENKRAREILEDVIERTKGLEAATAHARSLLVLAKILWDTAGDRHGAVERAEQALADLESGRTQDPKPDKTMAELRAWLDAHVIASPEDPFAPGGNDAAPAVPSGGASPAIADAAIEPTKPPSP